MTELTLAGALEEIMLIQQTGSRVGMCGTRAGRITVDAGGVMVGVDVCPLCDGTVHRGFLLVRHDDGRSVRVDMAAFHNVAVGHPMPGLATEQLIGIVADR